MHNSSAARIAFWVIGLLTVFFTAMYLFRGIASLFQPVPSALVQPRFFSPFHLAGIIVGSLGLIGILLALWVLFVPFLAPAIGTLATPYAPADDIWPASHLPLLVLALVAALAGWGLAVLLQARPMLSFVPHSHFAQTLYVLFLNKFYFDEAYSLYIVQPTLRMVKWLWREIDVRGINRLIHGIAATLVLLARWLWRVVDVRGIDDVIHRLATNAILFAQWLWRVVDVRGIDRTVVESGNQSVGLAQWLWEAVDVRQIEKGSDQIGRAADASGKKLNEVEPRTIQHHLGVLITWLVAAILFFYWLVL
jgi:NADH-quinone oxidoreductase subunit L